ncbi:RHS repeat-associated core domain-containing protein [Microbulbifer discodermiae]|uniref:RHS repeat-associated core domain-containing protein n=1 Tax=Microbulbifer sp. 2201CG32-9 TaxID=3232309 RepID=UPI00345B599C
MGRFYYNYYRDYDPRIGRYLQSDPIGLDDGPNTYSYVDNSPITYVDQNGLNKRRPGAPSPLQSLTNVQVRILINQIRQIDPAYRFPVASPGGSGQPVNYSPTTVRQLQRILNYAQNANVCGPAATAPVGRSGNNPLNVLPSPLTSPTMISGVPFSQHALQQMRARGIPPTPVLNAIQNGTRSPGNEPGTTMHVAPGVTIITSSTTGNVITVIPNGT